MPTEEEIQKLIEQEKKLGEYQGEDKVISSTELKEKVAIDKEKIFFKSSFPTLDRLIDGFEPGELIIISGPTKHGKTTLAKTFTENFARQDIKTIWFSYEMPPRQLLEKFKEDVIWYLPAVLIRKDLAWIEERIWEGKIKYGTKIVIIDHLHYLFDIEKARYPSIEIGYIIRTLKTLAIKHNVVIFLVCHLTKTKIVSRSGEEISPSVEDLRDSSFIAQESDCVLLIQRIRDKKQEFLDKARLKIEIHRRKGIMGKSIPLIFEKDSFFELETGIPKAPTPSEIEPGSEKLPPEGFF